MEFTHLHVHSDYSILDGAASIKNIIKKVKKNGQKAIALTDHGNMYGAKEFFNLVNKSNEDETKVLKDNPEYVPHILKPIFGIETYVAPNSRKIRDERGFHLILLAKNMVGYKNLLKISSLAFMEGYYYNARCDRELLEECSEGIIASSACLGGEISKKISKGLLEEAEEAIKWHKKVYGEDFYLELMRHKSGIPKSDNEVYARQQIVNAKLIEYSKKYDIKLIATNDCHFVNAEDAKTHDILICLNTGNYLDDENRMKYTTQEYIKSTEEMVALFSDIPEAIENTQEIVDKVEVFDLKAEPIMPKFPLPKGIDSDGEYLECLTYFGSIRRYGNDELKGEEKALDGLEVEEKKLKIREIFNKLPDEVTERINFELKVILDMGYPGYFLIVQDFIAEARKMGVWVGPGRGSAAGSAVAYCLKITDIDPIKYLLLFERFLNPDRVSMPDIDIDFDDDGRAQVMKYVVDKYGYQRVAQIVTFGTMATKSSIKDVARTMRVSPSDSNALTKLVPDKVKNLEEAIEQSPELKERYERGDEISEVLNEAKKLEGTIRQTGVHACGVIICRDNLYEHIPVCTNKASNALDGSTVDSNLLVTQFEGSLAESVGMLKMDFLGLTTLSIMKEAVENIKKVHGVEVDIENVSLEDEKVLDLYCKGNTTSIFQFESDGMKKHLKDLKPSSFDDLVAMNALYRPGPMQYIPNYIKRKHGEEPTVYLHPLMEKYLKTTYGITVYQEQVMLLSRELANFTRGDSDTLRKAMGKKIKATMDKLKEKFIQGCKNNPLFMEPLPENTNVDELINSIWSDWEAFAEYAFNKSHSVCYAYVSYKTAYLKAYYPAEFMAAAISKGKGDSADQAFLLDDCKKQGIKILPPDVNHSFNNFSSNLEGNIHFGFKGIKGLGDKAIEAIIEERNKNGKFKDIYDFITRINLRVINKKCIESLAMAGAFDCFEDIKREHFFGINNKGETFIESLINYANSMQSESSQANSLFSMMESFEIPKPKLPKVEEWTLFERMLKENEVLGLFVSSHPLEQFKAEINVIKPIPLSEIDELLNNKEQTEKNVGKRYNIIGFVKSVSTMTDKNGNPFARFVVADLSREYTFTLFSKDYLSFKEYLSPNYILHIGAELKKRYNGETELRIVSIDLLQNAKEKIFKKVSVIVDSNVVTKSFIEDLSALTKANKGNYPFYLDIIDYESQNIIKMFSRTIKIDINKNIVDFFETCPDLKVSFN